MADYCTILFADLRQRHVWPSEWESTSNNTEKFCGVLYPLGYETVVFANTLKASHLIGEKSIFLSNGKKLSSNIMLHRLHHLIEITREDDRFSADVGAKISDCQSNYCRLQTFHFEKRVLHIWSFWMFVRQLCSHLSA